MTPAPVKPAVSVSTLEALDVRVGTITAVGDVPGSAKLVRLIVEPNTRRNSGLTPKLRAPRDR